MTGKELVDRIYQLKAELREANAQAALLKDLRLYDEDTIISPRAIKILQERKADIIKELDLLQDSEIKIKNIKVKSESEEK